MPAADKRSLRRLFWPLLAVSASYSLLLVWATHHPKPQEVIDFGANPPSDKALHFLAYGLLGTLMAATLATSRSWSHCNALKLAVVLALAGIVDEATQPLFGRAADPLDWIYDCLGIVTGIAFTAGLKRLWRWWRKRQ